MSLAFLRWGVLILVCLIAPLATAAEAKKLRRPKAKGAKLVHVQRGERLQHAAAAAFKRMHESARTEGVSLRVTSGYRSRQEQRWLYERYRKGLGPQAARPGRSNHQRGLAVDLVVGDVSTTTYEWLASNACRFGFRRTVASEPWHWEYRPRTTRAPAKGQDCLGRDTTPDLQDTPLAKKDPS
ncbi:D-alanyl-D-alanine carboxypeptidase [Pyxidicoccus fallax]|uniref:D-alanyl-D-alanine carboxypeptidase n=1 Tax=Pyxidicoccus fallax TaxID=394095 RepID=A0A848LYN1_9BACT|nr:M15 family metallopeptidase [Pyxidicoccus fallax]NMO22739.1 D-alanyl-D-alanine carboxypeptidase [Pyxidicoccus fallax]NPC85802.1 D-alanyl-D-alanine carboxypeptidase [Pyxidicoccus fallax]